MTGRRSADTGTRRRSPRWVWTAGIAAVVLIGGGVATGAAVAAQRDGGAPAGSSSSASSSGGASSSATADPGRAAAGHFQDPSPTAAPKSGATPVSVSIPAIGVGTTNLEDLHRGAAGELDPPKSFDDAGWFSDGVVPGQVGPAVIAGHVDSITSAAVFYRLDELVSGDEVHVAMSDGSTLTFTVTKTEQAAKNAFPTSDVYGPAPTAQLRLITCDGTFDTATGHYRDNLIVFADLSST